MPKARPIRIKGRWIQQLPEPGERDNASALGGGERFSCPRVSLSPLSFIRARWGTTALAPSSG